MEFKFLELIHCLIELLDDFICKNFLFYFQILNDGWYFTTLCLIYSHFFA